jgi:hypothetical protein
MLRCAATRCEGLAKIFLGVVCIEAITVLLKQREWLGFLNAPWLIRGFSFLFISTPIALSGKSPCVSPDLRV